MNDASQSSLTTLRRCAELEVSMLLETRKIMWEEHSASFRWLMASLLALNGTTAIAILNTDSVMNHTKIWAISCCVLGVIFSLTIAWIGQIATRRMAEPLGHLIGYWTAVAIEGERFEDVEAQYMDAVARVMKNGIWAQFAGWCAVVCFLLAIMITGFGLAPDNGRIREPELDGSQSNVSKSMPSKAH